MNSILSGKTIAPVFLSGLFDDPLLLIQSKGKRENILIDCGQIDHIAKRVIKSVSSVFVTHAHMDHFIGLDRFIRSILVDGKQFNIFGPPGIIDKIRAKLKAYDWNLVEDYFSDLVVKEIFPDYLIKTAFSGANGFEKEATHEKPIHNNVIFENQNLMVQAEPCDHKITSLIFRITEKPQFEIDKSKIKKLGIDPGTWIQELTRLLNGKDYRLSELPINSQMQHSLNLRKIQNARELYHYIQKQNRQFSIGYITDIGMTHDNFNKVKKLLAGITVLFCECTYLSEQKGKARQSFHLCTEDLNLIMSELEPKFVIPIHHSKINLRQSDRLYSQLVIHNGCELIRLPDHIMPPPQTSNQITQFLKKHNSR